MMLSKIYKWLAIAGGFALSIMTARFYRQKAKREEARADNAEAVRDANKRNSEALVDTEAEEERKVNEAIESARGNRDHFS